jgi:hypothetical protein
MRVALLLLIATLAYAADWGRVTVSNDGERGAILENSRLRIRYGQYITKDVGPKDAIVELVVKPGTENLAGRIDSRSANSSKEKANRLTSVQLLHDGDDRKTVRLDYGDGSAVQDVSIYPDEPWIEITYLHHDVNIFDTAGPKLEYEVYGAKEWAAARNWQEVYPAYPESFYRKEWGAPGPLDYWGYFILGAYDPATGRGYGRVMPSADVDVIKLLFSRGFEMFPHYRPRRPQRSFTGYLFVVTGGAREILERGKALAERAQASARVPTRHAGVRAPRYRPADALLSNTGSAESCRSSR